MLLAKRDSRELNPVSGRFLLSSPEESEHHLLQLLQFLIVPHPEGKNVPQCVEDDLVNQRCVRSAKWACPWIW